MDQKEQHLGSALGTDIIDNYFYLITPAWDYLQTRKTFAFGAANEEILTNLISRQTGINFNFQIAEYHYFHVF